MNPKSSVSTEPVDIALVSPLEILLLMLAFAGGALVAAVVLPQWLPGLTESLLGSEPKVFWYLARVTGVVAYVLLWLALVFGLVVSNKMARLWNGGPAAVELHQFVTWLAIAFAVFHALILLGDRYIQATIAQVLTPFAYTGYKPLWVGAGQIALYLAIIVAASFYVRKQIGYRVWRTFHYVSFLVFTLLTLHGIFSGSDTLTPVMFAVYAAAGSSIYFLLIVRILNAVRAPRPPVSSASRSAPHSTTAR